MNIQQWMSETRASDIMTRKVVTFGKDDTLADVAGALLDQQISGGPVVSDGRCVGVVSANDLVAAEETIAARREEFAQSGFWEAGLSLPVHVYEEKLAAIRAKIAPTAQQPVANFMTTDLVTVSATETLAAIVQKMVDAHIHRVVVVDDQEHLIGLISTIDVMAHLLKAGRMAEQTSGQ